MSKLDKRAISILVIAILALSFALPLVSVSATHTSTATVAFMAGASQVVGQPSRLDVEVTNVGPDPISTVIIDFTGTAFTLTGEGVEPGSWVGVAAAGVVTYTGDTIVLGTPVTFVPEVTNPSTAGSATNPVVKTSDLGVKATLTTGTASVDDIFYVADVAGVAGDGISIEYLDAVPSSPVEVVTVTTLAISVELADTAGIIDSTTDLVVAAINAHGVAGGLVDASVITSGTMVTGILGFPQFLSGGSDPTTDYAPTVSGTLTIVPPTGTSGFTIDHVDLVHVGYVDYGDVLTVYGSGVTAGSEVKLFWDYASGTYTHLLNTTEGNPNGTFDCDVKVPSDVVGDHYLWATDISTGETVSYAPLTMEPKITLSPSSGLVGDEITVKGYGFAAESETTLTFNGTALTTNPTTIETDELGYFTCTFDIPAAGYSEDHIIDAVDELTNPDDAKLKVGTSITITPDEGPTGTVVSIEGRGWTDASTMTFKMNGQAAEVVGTEAIIVDDGEFSAEIVIPGAANEGVHSVEAAESAPGGELPATVDFDVTGLQEIVVSPTYGAPGSTITVTGSNFTQIAGTDVVLDFYVAGSEVYDLKVTAETDADGTFEDTFTSPAIEFKTYDVTATDAKYHIVADDAFKVGLIAFIINPRSGPTGEAVAITGIGFASEPGDPGDFNLTFGEILTEYENLVIDEAITITYYVPTLDTGTYDVNVIDEDGNELTTSFMVTASTVVSIDPAMAPNEYDVIIEGLYFTQEPGADLEFMLFNSTESWDITSEVKEYDPEGDTDPEKYLEIKTILADGNFSAWWEVSEDTVLSLGDYTLNVTAGDTFFQASFSVVEARVSVEPRKAQFDRGDTIQFDINNDFKLPDAFIEIYSPDDILYWSTEPFLGEWWMQVEGLYTVPYYRQTAAENPMELQSDAAMGPWLYIMYYAGDELMNGTFTVGPSTAAQVEEKLTEIWASMEDLSTDINSITDELAGDIADLSGDIDDVVADVQDMVDDITADLAEELAGVAADTEAAVDELEDSIGDIAASQNELASDLEDSLQTSIDAKEAAEAAQDSAQGLTTLVYGAIAASLIAALAAVVSLMQISKKIA